VWTYPNDVISMSWQQILKLQQDPETGEYVETFPNKQQQQQQQQQPAKPKYNLRGQPTNEQAELDKNFRDLANLTGLSVQEVKRQASQGKTNEQIIEESKPADDNPESVLRLIEETKDKKEKKDAKKKEKYLTNRVAQKIKRGVGSRIKPSWKESLKDYFTYADPKSKPPF